MIPDICPKCETKLHPEQFTCDCYSCYYCGYCCTCDECNGVINNL